jgi:ELWxxDGT repeat protein
MGQVVFFNGTDGSSQPSQGDDLWVSDGTAAGTFAVGGARSVGVAGASGAGLNPSSITPLGGGVLFNGINSQFRGGVWFSNGTAAGTYEIGGLNSSGVAGVPSGGLFATNITVFGDKALFINQNVNDINGIWVTDGTAAGTFELGGPENKGISGRYFDGLVPEDLTSAGNKVIFVATDTDDYRGLWVTDGTTSGTVEIGGLNNAGISGAPRSEFDPPAMESFGTDVIFTFGGSIWVSDGTATGTVDIANGLTANEDLTVFGAKALFEDSGELWITDGTAAGTMEIGGSANAGIVGATHGFWVPHNFTVFGNKVIFTADDSAGDVNALWITDGTAAGTTEIGGLKNAGISGQGRFAFSPNPLVSIGTKFLFTATDPSGVSTLWVTDGTAAGTFELGGTNNAGVAGAPAAGLDPTSITASGGIGYFMSPDSTGTSRLWETDGTVAGTHVVAAGPTGLPFDPTDLTAAMVAAVNGEGAPDILWRNSSTGGVELWSPNGSGGFTYESLGAVSTIWQIQASGDFTGNGADDILWRNSSTGDVELWNANGSGGFTYQDLGVVNTSWQIAGIGDFTGDGEDGILWRNASTGGVELWNPNGSGSFTYDNLGTVSTSWQIAGTGDFAGDGKDGIVWRNATNGDVELWNSNGSGGFAYDNLGAVNSSWQIAGTGDFTGTGKDGILWRNSSTGAVELWNPNGSGGFTYDNLGVVGTSWQIVGTGDYSGDGQSGILWRNTNGDTELWNSNGSGGFTYQDLGSSTRAGLCKKLLLDASDQKQLTC